MTRSIFCSMLILSGMLVGGCVHSPRYSRGYVVQYGAVYTPPHGYVHGLRGQWTDPVIVRYRNGSYMLVCWPGARNKPVDQWGRCRD